MTKPLSASHFRNQHERKTKMTNKLRLLPLLILALICLCSTALAAGIPGQQAISYIEDATGEVTALTDDETSTAWTKQAAYGVDLTIHLYSGTVGEIWVRNGYAYTQNWYNHYDRVDTLLVTVYYQANRYTESYDSYRYRLTDAYRPNSYANGWNIGYQQLLLPKQYKGVTKIELTVESVANGNVGTGATISDIIVASGSHATATPKAYATATPKPYVVYVTATPGPIEAETRRPFGEFITPIPAGDEDDDDYPYVEVITARPTEPVVERITPRPTATPYLEELITPTPKPVSYPSGAGEIGYANKRLATRSGPGTMYDEPGSYLSAGSQVKVTSKSWDDNNNLWWYQFEFEYKGEWYRLYTTDSRIDVTNPDGIPEEPVRLEPLDTQYSRYEADIYYGPGNPYAKVRNVTMGEGKRCDIYVIENGWALVDYYDYGRDVNRRGWIPVDCLYGN